MQEDDMVIDAAHISNFIELSHDIKKSRRQLQVETTTQVYARPDNQKTFFGPMRAEQLERVIPGFVRVEVLQGDTKAQSALDPVAVAKHEQQVDAKTCCESFDADPATIPSSEQLVIWETAIRAMGVREFPAVLDWLALLPGNNPPSGSLTSNATIGSYWAGEDGVYGSDTKRPGKEGKLFAQQGGFMATREQILFFHDTACPGFW
jgi:hypothetical protein